MATLSDVAKLAGVSTATVSKVLSNTPYFTEETRLKVEHAIKELNYSPNLPARALASGRTEIIAVVFPYIYDPLFTDPFVLHMLQGIEAVCHERGYNLLLSTPRLTAEGPDDLYLRLLRSHYLDGMIALDNVPLASVSEPAHARDIPCITIGYHATHHYVRTDDHGGGMQAMQHILDLGHRQIGIISVSDTLNIALNHRLAGMRAAAEASGLNYDAIPTAHGDFSVDSGMAEAAALLAKHPDLTALICLNDRMAMGAIQSVRSLGKRVPEDISVIGFDDIPAAATFAPPLTTIFNQAPTSGQVAAQLLFDLIDGKPVESVVLPTQLVSRASTAPVSRES
ncbi:MAG: LacI family DNA-binding transcriptional regulator [Anaerolineae bacterium]|nr:LacI family DNA-binding transcriptional regulator [Anaerolineae bacterium]